LLLGKSFVWAISNHHGVLLQKVSIVLLPWFSFTRVWVCEAIKHRNVAVLREFIQGEA
jgi:hypothetical protein